MTYSRGGRENRFSLPLCLLGQCRFSSSVYVGLISLVLLACDHAWAAKRPEFKLLKTAELPAIGLKMPVMPEAREFPVPPPSIFTYEARMGEKTSKIDMYAPYELWRQTQQAGCWIDEHSNMLVLATITLPLPKGFNRQHATREEYEKKTAEMQKDAATWTPETLAQWAADFMQTPEAKVQPVAKRPFNLQDLYAFAVTAPQQERLAYAFRLNRAASGQSRAVSTWFFALFALNSGVNTEAARTTIAQDFLTKVTASTKTPPPAPTGAAKSASSSTMALKKTSRSPEFLASRQQVANSIKNMKDWWLAETENYIILSDLTARHRLTVKEVQENIELLRGAFEQFIPPQVEIRAVSVIRMFADSDQYKAYVGPQYAWSSGLWEGQKKELVIRPCELADNKTQREVFLQVVFHEGFHQYIFYALDEVQTAPWFNEGHAEFFRTARINERRLEVREDEMAAKVLEDILQRKLDLPAFLHISYEQFYAKDEKTLQNNYVLAWAIVYYLRKGAVLEKPVVYGDVLQKYIQAVVKTRDMNAATDLAFQGIDLTRFQVDFVKFWESKSKRSAASRNKIFKDYAASDR
jgi:hypothetical protein